MGEEEFWAAQRKIKQNEQWVHAVDGNIQHNSTHSLGLGTEEKEVWATRREIKQS